MMKLLSVLFVLFLSLPFSTLQAQCGSCNDSGNNISNTGGHNYTATTAQAYYWEICSGNASISGSRTSKNVSVSCSGNYTIKVTRFSGGNCYEACESRTCGTPPPTCPSSSNLYIGNEGGGGLCTTGFASIFVNSSSSVSHVNWTWALGGYSGTINNASTATPIYYPSGNWNNYYLVVCATVVFNNGTVCPKVCKSLLLNCGGGPGIGFENIEMGTEPKATLFPNPSQGLFTINSSNSSLIKSIQISNAQGALVKTIQNNDRGEIDLTQQETGIYFVEIRYEDGSAEVQKLILNR